MEPKAWQVHIFGVGSRIKSAENKPKPFCMSDLDPRSAAGFEELGQTLVLDASYHSLTVPCNVSGVKIDDVSIVASKAVLHEAHMSGHFNPKPPPNPITSRLDPADPRVYPVDRRFSDTMIGA